MDVKHNPILVGRIGEPATDPDNEFRLLLATVLKTRGKDRTQIACELTEILGRPVRDRQGEIIKRPITKAMLDEFTRNIQHGHESHLPAVWVPALCQVINDDELARYVLPEHLAAALEIGEAVLRSRPTLERALKALK